MIAFLLRYWPYIALVAALCVLGAIHMHDQQRYSALETKFATYQVQMEHEKVAADRAAQEALQAQIERARQITLNNQVSLHDLQDTTAAIAADRDRSVELARRLLADTARSAAASHRLPEASSGPAATGPGETGSPIDVAELLANVAAECRGNAAQLNALIAEIRPQL